MSGISGPVAVLVTGMHRSGTSALTSALACMGFDLGRKLMSPSGDNPRGFWENVSFVELHERLFAELGISWDDPRPLPEDWLQRADATGVLDELRERIQSEFGQKRAWAVKDPRICRIIPLWQSALQVLEVRSVNVFIIRHPREVAASLLARNGWGLAIGELLWLRYVFDAYHAMKGGDRAVVVYDRLLKDPVVSLRRMLQDVGIDQFCDWELDSVRSHFDQREKHHCLDRLDAKKHGFSDLAEETYAALYAVATGMSDWSTIAGLARNFDSLWESHAYIFENIMPHLQDTRRRDTAAHTEIQRLQRVTNAEVENAKQMNHELTEARISLERARVSLQAADLEAERSRSMVTALESEMAETRSAVSALESEAMRAISEFATMRSEQQAVTASMNAALDGLHRRLEVATARIAKGKMDTAQSRQGLAEVKARYEARCSDLDARFDILNRACMEEVIENRKIFDGLQNQINLLKVADADLMWVTLVSRGVHALPKMVKQGIAKALKAFVLAGVSVLPGSAERRQSRLRALRIFYATAHNGVSSAALAKDVNDLAKDRWIASPAYKPAVINAITEEAIDLSVVLYDSERWIDVFFDSLQNLDYPHEKIRLLLRDHSQNVKTRDAINSTLAEKKIGFAEVVYSRGENRGFGAGHNHNFSLAKANYFLVCNVDGYFRRNAILEIMRAIACSSERVAAWEFRQTPYEHPKYYDPVTMQVSWMSGACVLFRAATYRAVGGFDDAIFMYGEDVDISYRLRARGFALIYAPKACFHHDTYEKVEAFKPLQFHGSTLANALLRLRFGRVADIAAIPLLWWKLGRTAHDMGVLQGHWRTTRKLLRHATSFLLSRLRMPPIDVPFAGWDYGIRREGAFEPVAELSNERPLVSILVRTYRGREEVLRHALISIANQTYDPIEVVLVEDKGETLKPQALAWAKELGLCLRYFSSPNPTSNRCVTGNIALRESRGEYCCFLDDDDLLYPDHIEYLVSRRQASPDVGACYALAWETKIASDVEDTAKYRQVTHSTLSGMRREFDRELMRTSNYIPIQAILFDRALYLEHGGFDQRLENLEDWELWRRFSSNVEFKYCPKTTSLYHIPFDSEVEAARQALLDHYYPVAKAIGDEAESCLKSSRAEYLQSGVQDAITRV
jgi:GT2 family glycosyltransferase